MRKVSVLQNKSFNFAKRIVGCTRYLQDKKKEFVMSRQVLRSGTAIGALIREAEFARSRQDFCNKMTIALKEANETDYWISLLKETEYINKEMFNSLNSDCCELVAMLVSTVKTSNEPERCE
ncbi:four helix bundle protein [Limihaloglobus sulfuriphilus]|uniref:Four helix bundle protein n=1 Tax=Limihaloglobus sulfuriphilus TaxID=1851148 RepID=A0A1Q2MGZ7_9BACT|nr:four helix bundle protein [Limihaloglobus sulfuriphilus]AQQ71924.1 four helix bundle protein [Limihaloglobus sulfuriphilus]